jgi:hypothetical protein
MRDLIDALEKQRKLEEGSIGSERTEDRRSYDCRIPEGREGNAGDFRKARSFRIERLKPLGKQLENFVIDFT